MKKVFNVMLAAILVCLPLLVGAGSARADDKAKDEDRLQNAGEVLKEIMDIPDDIPQTVIDKADCVIVIPSVLKGAFGVGASYGRGAMTCRSGSNFRGPWGAPTMMALEGVSFGFQLGGQATDFVLLVMNERGASSILSSKVKLGGDAAASAGPVGRNAQADTDVTLRAEILTYSRSRGLFAGVSLDGSTLRPDNDANERIYGRRIDAKDIVLDNAVPVPPSAKLMIATLNRHSPKNLSRPWRWAHVSLAVQPQAPLLTCTQV
jgi:SH3 domain-containing YSC84-like protein 1